MQSKFITNELCYETAGIPSTSEIKKILQVLIDNNVNFDSAHIFLSKAIKNQGYSLSIVLKELIIEILNNESILKNIPHIISDLSDLENMVTKSTFGDIYITSLVGIFKSRLTESKT
jgi:hypothetical protein